jgi:hypothetical protein
MVSCTAKNIHLSDNTQSCAAMEKVHQKSGRLCQNIRMVYFRQCQYNSYQKETADIVLISLVT